MISFNIIYIFQSTPVTTVIMEDVITLVQKTGMKLYAAVKKTIFFNLMEKHAKSVSFTLK